MNSYSKKLLAGVFWPRFSHTIELLNTNAQMLSAIRGYDKLAAEKFAYRQLMYQGLNRRLGNRPITYLEFGVWEGQTIRDWAEINTHPDSRFYGFDSFEGLPENWQHGFGRTSQEGRFDVGGRQPVISDTRVQFVKGWFQETVRNFLHNTELSHPLVVHVDCDLYSSTLYVLSVLDEFWMPGAVVIFDEYTSSLNEHRAWNDYQRAFMRKSDCIAMSDNWSQTAFLLR